jgi:glutathione peroxidase
MKRSLLLFGICTGLLAAPAARSPSIYDFNLPDVTGHLTALNQYKGKVLLIVNIASGSSLTPQLGQLETLYEKYRAEGLEILAFPSNDFGAEEPNPDDKIKAFCKDTYHVTYPLFGKIAVRGDEVTPLFHYLTKEANPKLKGDVHWNFTKFLVDRKGKLVARYEPDIAPDDPELLVGVEKALAHSDANSPEQPTHSEPADGQRRPRSDE